MAYIQDWGMRVQAQPQINTTRRAFLHLSQNENGRMLNIRITDVNIPAGSTAVLAGTKPDGTVYSQAGTLAGNTATFAEDVQMTAVAGTWDAKITVTNGGNCICTARITITIDPDTVAGGAIPSDSQLDGIIAECREIADSVRKEAYGSPLVADAVEDMTDQSRVYVYTGSESGMTAGHWYYYNGSAWADGGVYNAVAVDTDTTLTIAGKAADAKETGDQITELKSGLSELTTATAEDVGKALKAKTVTNGKVTEWEFGEAGGSIELDATLTDPTKAAQAKAVGDAVEKTVTAYEEAEYTGNIVDTSNASRSGQWIKNLRMAHLDGTFYSNPLVMNMGFVNAYPRDAEENSVSFVGSSSTSFRIGSSYIYKIEISGLTVIQTIYESLENFNNNVYKSKDTYTLSAIPDHWYIEGKTASGTATSTNYGLTAEPSETYVAYAEPVINYGYRYAGDLDEHIGEVANSAVGGIATATVEDVGKTPKIKSVADGGVTEWEFYDADSQFEPSYNLIDVTQFNDSAVSGYWNLKAGYYFPVTAGKKICTSAFKPRFYFYDSAYTAISNKSVVNAYTLVDIPTGAVWARMNINASDTSSIDPHMVVYEVDSTTPSNDDRRMWVPPTKIKGSFVEGDIYDTAVPQNLSIDILTASAYKAVRVLNHQRNAFRIATFNIYVTRQRSHWSQLKQELKDHSIDICAMQEVSNDAGGRYVQNFLTMNTWQFKYGSQAVFDGTLADKATVSVFEIVSTELFNTSTNRPYTKTVINLPQYKRNAHQFTLSVYSAHLNLTASNRLIEASEILATVAQDTSDFIVICMDSNTFKSEADAQGKLPTWEAFISAGFTPIHYGAYSTITDMTDTQQSLDQIFMGENISLIDYDIVNSNDYLVQISGQNLPISDHCMVYADLQFDFDAVLESLNS